MVDYVEYPVDLLRKIVLPKKPDGGGGGEPPGGFQCGSYGYGAILSTNGDLQIDAPYGPYLAEPFVGPIHDDRGNVVAMAQPFGLAAQALQFHNGGISFTTQQTRELSHQIPTMTERFFVGLVAGYETLGFRIDCTWYTANVADWPDGRLPLYGMDIVHASDPIPPPIDDVPPQFIMGQWAGEGSFRHTYDWKAEGDAIPIWGQNEWPYWPFFWRKSGQFAANNLYLGDWYTWLVTAICGDKLPEYQ